MYNTLSSLEDGVDKNVTEDAEKGKCGDTTIPAAFVASVLELRISPYTLA